MSESTVEAVRSRYGSVAKSGLSSEQTGVRAVAEAFGYSPEELASIPAEANMGLSCGNPTAIAHLHEGETVLEGRAIGIDMTPEMIDLARRNAKKRQAAGAPANVEFHLATIDKLPLADKSVDCVISNCVINLAPDKRGVFREIARVLKPGGRLAVSDIALKQPLPKEIGEDVLAYVGCIAGAISFEEYRQGLLDARFSDVTIIDSGADLNAYAKVENQAACCSPSMSKQTADYGLPVVSACCGTPATVDPEHKFHGDLRDLLSHYNVNDYAASVRVFAIKAN